MSTQQDERQVPSKEAGDVERDSYRHVLNALAVDAPPPPPPRLTKHIDLASLYVDQNGDDVAGTEEVATVIRVGKPKGDWFVQVHSTWTFPSWMYKDEDDRGREYFVMPHLVPLIAERVKKGMTLLACSLQGEFFFWPIPRPDVGGRPNSWHESARVAANLAKDSWVRMSADMGAGRYKVIRATGSHPPPKWPKSDAEINDLFQVAVAANLIDTEDHPIIVRLLGA